jgi:hypothetical protein
MVKRLLTEKGDLICMYDTELPTLEQALGRLNHCWDEEIVTRLPSQLDEMARHLHAFERVRAIKKPSDLLRGLVARALQEMSFESLGIWASLINMTNISANAWRKRLLHSSAWLQWLLGELLAAPRPLTTIPASHGHPVWLVDATRLQQDGDSGDDWRLHVVYDVMQARLVSVTLTDGQTGEGLWHLPSTPGTIEVGDRAYGTREATFFAADHQLLVVNRITPTHFPCWDEHHLKVDLVPWLREAGPNLRSRTVWIWDPTPKSQRRLEVRVVAKRVSEQAAQREIEKVKLSASKHGRGAITAETLELAHWIVVVTTLPACWSDQEVMDLYHCRWQIELLFKRMKSLAHLAHLPMQTVESNEAYLRAWLICWALQEEVQHEIRQALDEMRDLNPWEHEELAVSRWTLTKLTLQTLRQVVIGYWTLHCVKERLASLKRYLIASPRQRVHLETMLLRRLIGVECCYEST